MAGKRTITGEIILEYLSRFPNSPDLTIARKIYNENKSSFKSLEVVRSSVRAYRGHMGDRARGVVKENSHFKPVTNNRNPFDIPEESEDSYKPFILSQSKVLYLSDLHFPYHELIPINTALEYGYKKGINTILINGDLIDMPNHSRHEKDWRSRSTAEEFEITREFLRSLRKHFPDARIIYKEGNHDERWENWLYVKAPEIFNDSEFKLEARLRLGELKIEKVGDRCPVHIGKLPIFHGHEFIGGGSGGQNPSTGIFNKTLYSTLVGHFHKRSVREETTIKGDIISVNTTGCLCKLNPYYARVNKWGHGFAYIEHDIPTGEYKLDNLKIINGKVY